MSDIDMSTGTGSEYLGTMVAFWVALVVGVVVMYRYVWPVIGALYWKAAAKVYWTLRTYCEKSRGGAPTLYSSINVYKKEDKK